VKNFVFLEEETQMSNPQIRNYPHVNVSVDALLRPQPPFVDTGATALLVPFKAERGSDKVEKIYNLSQFINEYGTPDFESQGRTILNAYNWLTRGGVIYAVRLNGLTPATFGFQGSWNIPAYGNTPARTVANVKIDVEAKYKGTFYNGTTIQLQANASSPTLLDLIIRNSDNREVQRITRLSSDNFLTRVTSSPYIGKFTIENISVRDFFEYLLKVYLAPVVTGEAGLGNDSYDIVLGDLSETPVAGSVRGTDASESIDELIVNFFDLDYVEDPEDPNPPSKAVQLLGNRLEHSIDLILDAGYSLAAKEAIRDYVLQERTDVVAIFDTYDFSTNSIEGTPVDIIGEGGFLGNNIAIYAQKITVDDPISGRELWVTPTYFLSRLIPVNDDTYGIQWPTAGLTRGVLSDAKGIDFNPKNSTDLQDFRSKEYLYVNRLNYIERDARGYRFMSQSTRLLGPDQDTALRFLNNTRVVNRMVRELENLGREYLFEFNDATTLKNMSSALNRYVGEWIQNRTLSYGLVTVDKNPFSDEKVDVNLNIKFTGTIEIISIAITIE
jgi:hypothetical protein